MIIFSINHVIGMVYFVDTLLAYATLTENDNHGPCGGATPSAEPTPRKRGPLPKPSWRRGRLPSCKARPRRATASPGYLQFPCKNFPDALRLNLRLEPLSVVVARAARGRRAARPMVRLGMALQDKEGGYKYLANTRGAHLRSPRDGNATVRLWKRSAALTSARPGLGSCA